MYCSIATGVKYKNWVYFYDYCSRALFKLFLESGEIEFVLFFDDKEKDALYGNACLYGNNVWFIPHKASRIARVNLDNLEITYYPFNFNTFNRATYEQTNVRIHSCIIDNKKNRAFLIPTCMDAIPIINFITNEIEYIYDIVKPDIEIMGYGVVSDENLWLFPIEGKRSISIDLTLAKSMTFPWSKKKDEYGSPVLYDGKVWFSPGTLNTVMEMDIRTNKTTEYTIPPEFNGAAYSAKAAIFNKKMWIVQICSNKGILTFDFHNKRFELIKKQDSSWNWMFLSFIYSQEQDGLIISTNVDKRILWINEEEIMTVIKGNTDDDLIKRQMISNVGGRVDILYNNLIQDGNLIKENILGINELIQMVR